VTAARPNILLLVIDAARADRLSCMGYGKPTTPHLDRLAAGGILYRQAISTATWTVPAHASLFTGQYLSKHRASNQTPRLAERVRTLAEALAAAGYRTGSFTNNPYAGSPAGLGRGFARVTELWSAAERGRPGYVLRRLRRKLSRRADSGAAELNRRMLEFARAGAGSRRPWFIFANYVETHLPLHGPAVWRHRFVPAGATRAELDGVNLDPISVHLGKLVMTERDYALLGARYDAQLAYADHRLGELVDRLAGGDLQGMLAVVLADHGENLGEHGLMSHEHCVYDTLLHVPLIVSWPGTLAPCTVDEQVQILDVPVAVLAAAGIRDARFDAECQGINLLDAAARRQRPWAVAEHDAPRAEVVEERYRGFPRELVERSYRAWREAGEKLIWRSDGAHEYYRLDRDPGETRDLAAAAPERVAELSRRLACWVEACEQAAARLHGSGGASGDRPPPAGAGEQEAAVRARLRELGYLD